MESPFEKTAKQAAVEAGERRWDARHAVERRAQQARKRKVTLAAAGLLAVALAAGAIAMLQTGLPLADLPRSLVRPLIGLTNAERARIDSFTLKLQAFGTDDIRPWKSASQEIRPKRAPSGLTYRMLVETKDGHCGLYELVSDGKGQLSVCALDPIGRPLKISLADFNRARRDGGVYLTAVGGHVYVCGSDDPEEGRAFARRMGVGKPNTILTQR